MPSTVVSDDDPRAGPVDVSRDDPERALLVALLERLLRDALNVESYDHRQRRRLKRESPRKLETDAEMWFRSDSEEPFSFIWICNMLDLDPSVIFALLKRKAQYAAAGSIRFRKKRSLRD